MTLIRDKAPKMEKGDGMTRFKAPCFLLGILLGSAPQAIAARPLPAAPVASSTAERVDALGERVVEAAVNADPTMIYFIDIEAPDHHRWPDRSPDGIDRMEAANDALYAELRNLGGKADLAGASEVAYALIEERLESERRARICRPQLWMGVSHLDGWHLSVVQVAEKQPVETARQRADAIARWEAFPAFVDQEIANLKSGIAQGYTAPKRIVHRVVRQLSGIIGVDVRETPLYSPAKRSADTEFAQRFEAILIDGALPALRRYQVFLEQEYLAAAREALAVSAHPDGLACYEASLRGHTTLDRSAEQTYAIGTAEVERNMRRVTEIGSRMLGTGDFDAIVRMVAVSADNRFEAEPDLVEFSRQTVARARDKSRALFQALPDQALRVEPFEPYMRGTGTSAFYQMEPAPAKPAYYRIPSENWATETRGGAEITAIHEGYPGHHMQISFMNGLPLPRIAKLGFNNAIVEGWARYAEALAEEVGLYSTDYALISRRAWAARGMVADPGLHVMGWSRGRTAAYLASTGRIGAQEAEDLVDRMAIMPGQLTAYDTGALAIMALRRQAEHALGAKFDIRAFHALVLGKGAIPLSALQVQVDRWIKERQTARP